MIYAISPSEASACQTTKTWVITNPARIPLDQVLDSMFPEFLVTYDSGSGILTVTGCAKHMEPIEKLVAACNNKSPDAWGKELEQQLWTSRGEFRNSVYEFTLRRPSSQQWKVGGITQAGSNFTKAVKGQSIFHMELLRDKTRLSFDVFDVEGYQTAQGILEKMPSPSQSVRDEKWSQTQKEDIGRRVGGVLASNAPGYSIRDMWVTSGGSLIREMVAVAHPTPEKDATRIYIFHQTIREKDFPLQRNWLMEVAEGLQLPATPPRPLAPNAGSVIAATSNSANTEELKPGIAVIFKVHQSKSPSIQKANSLYSKGEYSDAEKAYQAVLQNSPADIRQEICIAIASTQIQQKRLSQAIVTLETALQHTSEPATEYDMHMRLATLYVQSSKNWKSAESHLLAARKIAPDKYSQWRAACQLARVPYYLLQYKQAIKAFEELLQTYPTSQTAEFARPYLWYLKNCTEKKI
ncbi:MAG TPA: tetratricopeptide repeat protein [Candidatus Methylacidiphilales bacterium]|nr:tetratricopeptide repeat protein [Candidatus Methylacidiphilales bacterium]